MEMRVSQGESGVLCVHRLNPENKREKKSHENPLRDQKEAWDERNQRSVHQQTRQTPLRLTRKRERDFFVMS